MLLQGSADMGGNIVPQPTQLPLSAESISRGGVYLMDTGWNLYLYLSAHASKEFVSNVLGVQQFSNIEQPMVSVYIWLMSNFHKKLPVSQHL